MPEWKKELRQRLVKLRLEPTREAEIVEELAQHLEDRYQELLAAGVTDEEAARVALAELSEHELLVQELRRTERPIWNEPVVLGSRRNKMFGDLWQDLLFGVRILLKKPSFTVIAVMTLALGIGANTAIFSIVNGVLLRALPYGEPQRLMLLGPNNQETKPVSKAELWDFRERSQLLASVSAFIPASYLLGTNEPEWIAAAQVTPDLFSTLGVQPLIGRGFSADEGQAGGAKVVVLGHGLWQRQFGSNPSVIGNQLALDGQNFTIVGVMPPSFQLPLDLQSSNPSELWTPLQLTAADKTKRMLGEVNILARLKPGVTLAQARTEARAISSRLTEEYRDYYSKVKDWGGITVVSISDQIVKGYRRALLILQGAVGLLLLIACANLANLLLAQSAGRSSELSIRLVLGASRLRLFRQLLTEGLLLAAAGGVAGGLLAWWGSDVIISLAPADIPRLKEITLDAKVLGFTFGLSLLTGIFFGFLPVLKLSQRKVADSLKAMGRATEAPRQTALRRMLVVSEIALTCVLLVGAGLMMRSLRQLWQVDPGFESQHVLTTNISLPRLYYPNNQSQVAFYGQLIERVKALPGVQTAAAVRKLPLDSKIGRWSMRVEDEQRGDKPITHTPEWQIVTPDYFRTLGVSLLEGRFFTDSDGADAPGVVIVNETMARQYWPQGHPVGRRIKMDGAVNNPWITVIGVTKDVRQSDLTTTISPQMYLPHAQFVPSTGPYPTPNLTLVVRTASEPLALSSVVRNVVRSIDKNLPVGAFQTMEQVRSRAVARTRFQAFVLGGFSAIALLLAAVGIYGVMSYTVAQRTHEIGIRIALGARQSDVLKLVVTQGLKLTLIGATVGVAGAFGLTRLISSLLYGVTTTDPLTFVGVALLLILVALLACYLPARRAMKVDPIVALRYE